ncbi:N-acetylmuramoyl-L-alanine amidase [Streptomyces sp. A7024]|uniref:N-acetylmuramoyl-L-alanine amidase n=1 Tax=Streptomyces coryli TaxID=1128680 RepID=A0A6G4TVN8_9ACTN|nr:peptidoglycan recognition family protein [Streptomyces coryli]NGN63107.1 N-acetylmuramoyl-L-alanine amidase [Streptomyces coryli]
MDLARPTRRRLLQGAAVTAAAAALGPLTARSAHAAEYPPTHWIPAAPENFRVADRPNDYPIDKIVIHVTQEYFQDAVDIFQDPARQVSTHYLIASADGYIAKMLEEKDVGWHAGNRDYNNTSIGIEHEGWVDDPAWFTDVMYRQSALLTAAICTKYSIPRDRDHIIGHVEVPGSDHTDPGPNWDWGTYMKYVQEAG